MNEHREFLFSAMELFCFLVLSGIVMMASFWCIDEWHKR